MNIVVDFQEAEAIRKKIRERFQIVNMRTDNTLIRTSVFERRESKTKKL